MTPFEQRAAKIERHYDGINACCMPYDNVVLDFVAGTNEKIRHVQHKVRFFHDEDHLKTQGLLSTSSTSCANI